MGADGRSLPGTRNPIASLFQSQSRRVSRSRLRRGFFPFPPSVQVSRSLKIVRVAKEGRGSRPGKLPSICDPFASRERSAKEKKKREEIGEKKEQPARRALQGVALVRYYVASPPARRKPLTRAPVNQPFPSTIHANPRSPRGTLGTRYPATRVFRRLLGKERNQRVSSRDSVDRQR